MNINSVSLEGILVREPQLFYSRQGRRPLCKLLLDVEGSVSPFFVLLEGKTAILANTSLEKGHSILIRGSLQQLTYLNKRREKKQLVYVKAWKFSVSTHRGAGGKRPAASYRNNHSNSHESSSIAASM